MARTDSSPARAGARPGRRTALVWWGLAAVSLLGGYADLVRGGETIAPILLVLGYCVLIPFAILRS
jgi:hypothetical protein